MPAETRITNEVMRQVLDALETAQGVCELVASNIRPSDLDQCEAEIRAARDALRLVEEEAR
jgi:hypothetical protein